MPYTFRVIFSGPCAYVPNIVKGGDPRDAKSWSVILPDLQKGYDGDADGIPADRHRAALVYSPDDFEVDKDPDAILSVRDKYKQVYKHTTLFFLDGHRVTFDLPGADSLTVKDVDIDSAILSDPDVIKKLMENKDELLQSMTWLPAMGSLRKDLQWFGARDPVYYFRGNGDPHPGYPEKGHLAAHILLEQGNLVTDQLDNILTAQGIMPTIWEFRRHEPPGPVLRTQALANSIALEVRMPEERQASITIAYSPTVRKTLTLKKDKLSGTRSIEIKNRELEAIFLPHGLEIEHSVDFDFRYLYGHAEGYKPDDLEYPLPHELTRDGGNEVGTCGGTKYSGFSDTFSEVLKLW